MSLVDAALKRPYTVASVVLLLAILGGLALLRMPTDIFPEINIPVVSVVWTFNGMPAEEMESRVIAKHERSLPSLVDDIEHMESNSYNGVGVIKIFLHPGADVSRAVAQLTSSAQTVLKSLPRGITPPLVIRYGATDVPIIQLSLSSKSMPDQKITDYGQNFIRPALAVVHGAQVPFPYGGKPRVIMVDLDTQALQARGLSPADVSDALNNQNIIIPSGTAKIGEHEYNIHLNNTPDTIEALNNLPLKTVNDATIYLRDVGHVRDGCLVQTNAVHVDSQPGGLMTIRKTGGASTLSVIDGLKSALPQIQALLPGDMTIKPLFDQSIFVQSALNGVLFEGLIAAALTALMIWLFLGNARLTFIILLSIPLSIVAAILIMYVLAQSLNTMTLGGLALAVGILVDNATVVIENIERRLELDDSVYAAIVTATREIAGPTLISTLCICIVFAPVFLLQGTAKYLFMPMAMAVIFSLGASLVLSFTLVPVMFHLLVARTSGHGGRAVKPQRWGIQSIHRGFIRGYDWLRDRYAEEADWFMHYPVVVLPLLAVLIVSGFVLFPRLGTDFFPRVDAGQIRLHVRAPSGTRIEETQEAFGRIEKKIGELIGPQNIETLLDNIGLPSSGLNMALSDTATLGPMDGEILIALNKQHPPTDQIIAELRRQLPELFPQMLFFMQPADIVNQVLNFGLPAPIDVRVYGPKREEDFSTAQALAQKLRGVAGVTDVHIFQEIHGPQLRLDVDRTLASQVGMLQRDVANSLLVSLSSSQLVAPNFWVNPKNRVSYQLVVQTPQYRLNSLPDLESLPLSKSRSGDQQLLMNVADISRGETPMVISHYDVRPIFDVHADVQGTDMGSVAAELEKLVAPYQSDSKAPVQVRLAGQLETMRTSFAGLFGGIGFSIVLVYLLMVISFQSWIDPLIVLAATPAALAGVVLALYATDTHLSVPALMGTIMCIGLATANSILVVSFANQRLAAGDDPHRAAILAGITRLRPVIMTAGAMILGMLPMSLGLGEGGEQNAPLARAVIGGLILATAATLLFVPVVFGVVKRRRQERDVRGIAFSV